MKILHIIFSLNTGGAETLLIDIVNEQCKKAEVELIIINNNYDSNLINLVSSQIKIHLINRKEGSKNPISVLKLNYLLFSIKANVIHAHDHKIIRLIYYKGFSKTFLTVHDTGIESINFARYNRLFAISYAVKMNIFNACGLSSTLIYNGIDFSKIDKKTIEQEKCPIFKIVQVSRLNHNKKGQHILLKALSILIYQKGIKNIKVDFIGEGDSLNYLEKLAIELNISEYVNFLGLKDRAYIYSNLKNYDLLVQPSIFEGFGLTVVEGIAAKIPVLVSKNEGPFEIIEHGKYGYWFENGDIEECVEKILKIIYEGCSKEFLFKIENAYKYALQNFSIENTANSYLTNYTLK